MAVPRPAQGALAACLASLLLIFSRQASGLRVQPQAQEGQESATELWPGDRFALGSRAHLTKSDNQWVSTGEFLSFSQKPKKELTDMSSALACLRKTTPHLPGLHYPEDAEEHALEIRDAMRPWLKEYVGSFHVEDMWNLAFADAWFNRTNRSARLWQFFGPYVPILVQWVEPWFRNEKKFWYPEGMIDALRKVIRKDVLYAAVSQNDEGLVGHNEFKMSEFPNIVVFSAGGYGHVPVPLLPSSASEFYPAKFCRDVHPLKSAANSDKYFARALGVRSFEIPQRKYFVSYVGSLTHAPDEMRARMQNATESWAQENHLADRVVFFHGGTDKKSWRDVMEDSRFTLTPRGYGRTAYHLAETIQHGLIPIYLYTDVPWIPYPKVFDTMGYVTTVEELPSLLDKLKSMSDREVKEREAIVVARDSSHFTPDAIMQQMKNFLTGDATDLVCGKLPPHITGSGKWGE